MTHQPQRIKDTGQPTSAGEPGRTRSERLMAVVGLAALIVSLLIYSASVTPFGAHPGYSGFMRVYAPMMLGFAALVSAGCAVLSALGRELSRKSLLLVGGLCFTVGSIAFAVLSLTAAVSLFVLIPLALITGAGDVALCLIWGRIYRRFEPEQALINISAASMLAAGMWLLLSALSEVAVSVSFCGCVLVAVALGFRLSRMPAVDREGARPENGTESVRILKVLPSLVDVVAMPMLGLIVFAYVVGVLRSAIIASFGYYLTATVVVCVVLLVYALGQRQPLRLRSAQSAFISLLAVLLLTVGSLSPHLALSQDVIIFLAYVLYVMAAVLTLSSLVAIAHADEFAPDLIFSLAVFLFSGSSVAGLLSGELIADESVNVVLIIATTVYACVALLFSYLRWRTLSDWSEAVRGRQDAGRAPAEACTRIARERQLTAREEEVLRYLAEGHNGVFISEVLSISPNTVRTHIHNIYRKLDVSCREDILRLTRE